MKDKRPGEELWLEWHGLNYYPEKEDAIVYYTFGDIDLDNEVVRRALASSLQRDGVADSLGDGFKYIEKAIMSSGWAGTLEEEHDYIVCNEEGETEYGDIVDTAIEITWIEI